MKVSRKNVAVLLDFVKFFLNKGRILALWVMYTT